MLATRTHARSGTQWYGLHRLHTFRAPYILFNTLSTLSPPPFLFFGGKYENYAIYASGVCFELKFDRRVKNQSVPESMQRGIQSMPLLPPTVCPNGGQNAVRTGAEGAVA